ncbi:MAG: PAS domain S-box protein [Planctomycetaceae bacterium]
MSDCLSSNPLLPIREPLNMDVVTALQTSTLLGVLSDLMSPAVLVTNQHNQVVWANSGFERLTGWRLDEIRGLEPSEFLHGDLTDQNEAELFVCSAQCHQPVHGELLNYRKDGSTFWVAIEARPVLSPEGRLQGHVSIQTDISQQKELEYRNSLDHRLLLAISRVQGQFITAESGQLDFQEVLEHLLELTNSRMGCLGKLQTDTGGDQRLVVRASAGSADEICPRLQRVFEEVLKTGRPLICPPADLPFVSGSFEQDFGVRTLLVAPISEAGRQVALLCLGNRLEGYDPDQIQFLQPLLETIGQLLRIQARERARRKAEDAMMGFQTLLEETQQVAGIGGWELTIREHRLRWTRQTRLIHEVPDDFEPTVEQAIQFYAPQARPVIAAAVDAGIAHGQPWDLELPLVTATGKELWVRAKGNVVHENGVATRLYGTFQDITERVHRELAGKQHRAILELIASKQPLPVILQQICEAVECSIRRATTVILVSDDQVSVTDVIADQQQVRLLGLLRGVSLEGISKGELQLEGVPTLRDRLTTIHPVTGGSERKLGAIMVVRDPEIELTVREQNVINDAVRLTGIAVHRALRDARLIRSEQLLSEAQRRARLGYWKLNTATGEIVLSPEFATLLGYTLDAQPGLDHFLACVVLPNDVPSVQEAIRAAIALPGQIQTLDIRCRINGHERWVCLEGTAGTGTDGQLVLEGIIQDIDDRKRSEIERTDLQAQLLQTQKIESIGRLAGGIAHDFNNMLAVILGHADVAMLDPSLSEAQQKHLRAIKRAGERSAILTRQLLTFARRQGTTPRIIDLNDTIVQMLIMLERLIGNYIQLIWEPSDEPAVVCIDPVQVDQIVVNLVVNARDAILDQGEIRIRTECRSALVPPITEPSVSAPDRWVVLTISDTGCGMDENVLTHMYDPFFTTKQIGEGTGLGLATVLGIVQQAGGCIRATSHPGRGTEFLVCLPEFQQKPDPGSPETVCDSFITPEMQILLVEDNPEVAQIAQVYLHDMNLKVISTRKPSEAIAYFQQHGSTIPLLVTDIVMPEMSGWDLAASLRQIAPTLRFLFISGNADGEQEVPQRFPSNAVFLQKPFSRKEFSDALLRLFANRRESTVG